MEEKQKTPAGREYQKLSFSPAPVIEYRLPGASQTIAFRKIPIGGAAIGYG